MSPRILITAALALPLLAVGATPKINPGAPAPYTGTIQSSKLYTSPGGPGGITGRIEAPPSGVVGIFAISREKQKSTLTTKLLEGGARSEARYRIAVHFADLAADNTFSVSGLQAGVYDLFVLLERDYYTGIVLSRQPSTLTPADIKTITDKINVSNPYFNEKHIARMAGGTGSAAKARILVQEMRTRPIMLQSGVERPDLQTRSIKLFLMEDVRVTGAPAWTAEETREIVRQEVGPPDTKGAIPEYFCKALSGIFVTDTLVDLGDIKLSKDKAP